MYSVFRQTDRPTAVEHALYCHFFNNREKQLVVCGGSHLRIFRVNTHVIENSNNKLNESVWTEQDGKFVPYYIFGQLICIIVLNILRNNTLQLRKDNIGTSQYDTTKLYFHVITKLFIYSR